MANFDTNESTQHNLSVSIISKNAEATLEKTLNSVYKWVKEIVIIDSYSIDSTLAIAKKYNAIIYQKTYEGEGKQRNYALSKIHTEWTFVLDADEEVTENLKNEIIKTINQKVTYSGYRIPIQSYYKGKKLTYGGESYSKMILFKTKEGKSTSHEIHAFYQVKNNNISLLINKLNHYSYLSVSHLFTKFTNYAVREARQKKELGEKTSLKKIFMYAPHMFWARFIKDKGYKDGLFRLPIDLAFAYLELATYVLMIYK